MRSAFGSLLDTGEWQRGSAWFEQLPFKTQYDVAQDLVTEEFDWRSWFDTRPTAGFMEGVEAAREAWNEKLSKGGGVGSLTSKGSKLEVVFARKSLAEERKAVKDYTYRLKYTRDPKLRKAIAHARKEEREHAALFVRWLKGR